MIVEEQREMDREQWRDLVRGLCLVQAGGYPGSVSISKRFLLSPADEIERMARMATHMVQEYGLRAELEVDGNGIVLRIDKAAATIPVSDTGIGAPVPEPEAEIVAPAAPHRAPFSRLLHLVHLPAKAQL
jgi:hypothetical protein